MTKDPTASDTYFSTLCIGKIAEKIYTLLSAAIDDDENFSFMESGYVINLSGNRITFEPVTPGGVPTPDITLE